MCNVCQPWIYGNIPHDILLAFVIFIVIGLWILNHYCDYFLVILIIFFTTECVCVCVSHSVMSDSLWPRRLSLPRSSVYRILKSRILEWVTIPFSRGSSWPRDRTQVSCRQIVYQLSHPRGLVLLSVPLSDLQVFSKISLHVMDHNDFNFLFSSPDIYL